MFKLLIFSILTISSSQSLEKSERRKCCPEDNIITTNGTCSDGSQLIVKFGCSRTFILDPNDTATDNFTLKENNELVIHFPSGKFTVPPHKYCLGKLEETDTESEEAAIICNLSKDSRIPIEIKITCCAIALILFLIIILIYLAVPTLRDLMGKCIIFMILSIAIQSNIMGEIKMDQFPKIYCTYIIIIYCFFLLSAYFWLSIIAFHVFQRTIMLPGNGKIWFTIYCLIGFGSPIILILPSIFSPTFTDHSIYVYMNMSCLNGSKRTNYFMYGPLLILLIATSITILCTVKKLWHDIDPNNVPRRILVMRRRCLLVFYMFLIIGVTWMIETLTYFTKDYYESGQLIWEIIFYVNDLVQAILLFLVLVILRKRSVRGLGMFGFFCISCPQKWSTIIDEEDGNQLMFNENKRSH